MTSLFHGSTIISIWSSPSAITAGFLSSISSMPAFDSISVKFYKSSKKIARYYFAAINQFLLVIMPSL